MAEAAGIMKAASSVVSTVGALRQGRDNADTAEYNADVALQNSQSVLDQADENARRVSARGVMAVGQARAAYGASGVTADGSAADVLAAGAQKSALDAFSIRRQGQIKSTAYQNEAALDKWKAGNDRISGYLGAASALLGGAGKVAGGSISGGGDDEDGED